MKHYQCELDGRKAVVTTAGDETEALRLAREQLKIPPGQAVSHQSVKLLSK